MEELSIKVGQVYELRNGTKTSPIRKSNNGTRWIFEATVEESGHLTPSILSWLNNGRFLTRIVDNPRDIVKQLKT